MKTKITILSLLCGAFIAPAQLRVDFGPTGSNPIEPGFSAYSAATTQPATFVTQSYSVFGTNVSITPVWEVATAGAIRMINRANAQTEANSLLRDWLGTDNRTASGIIPVTLTISNLPAGTYRWLSYHHDAADQTGLFDGAVADAKGSRTNFNIDISNGNLPLASVTKWITTLTSDGANPVRLRFRGTATTPTASSFFVMNGFELSFLGIASEWVSTGGGNWSDAANWDANGVPNSATSLANFAGSILAASTVNVNIPVTLSGISFASAQSYTLSGANTITLAGTSDLVVDGGSHTVAAPLAVSGGGGLTITGTGQLTLSGANTYTGPTLANISLLTITSLANGGSPSAVGASAADAANLTFLATLRYEGSGHTSDRLFTLPSGTRTLDASGSGALVLNNTGGLNISGTGTRTLVLTGTNAGNNTLNAALADDAAFNKTSLTKNGSGKWILGGANTSSGNVAVNEGTLALAASASLGNPLVITVQSNAVLDVSAAGGLALGVGQTLQGRGSIVGDVTDGSSIIVPGGTNAAGTLTFANNLSLTGNGTIVMDLSSSTTVGGGVNDLIEVGGNLDLSAINLLVNFTGTSLGGTYRLINYGGALLGTPNVIVQGLDTTRFNAVVNASGGQVNLVVSGTPASLVWVGDGGGNSWDVNASVTWSNTGTASLDTFRHLDSVTFNNVGSANSNVTLSVAVFPAAVTVNAASDYWFGGPGRLAGAMSLTKAGSGTLLVTNANTYTGITTVSGGVLKLGSGTALGFGGDVIVQSGATVDLNSFGTATNHFYVAGSGVGGKGVIVNTGADQLNAVRKLTLTGDAFVASDFRWDVRGPGGNNSFSGLCDLGGFTLTRVGTNRMAIVDSYATNAGNIVMVQGGMSLTRSFISGPGTIDVGTNFVWIENSTTGMISKPLLFSGGTLQCSGGDFTLDSFITNTSGLTIDAGNVLTLKNPISGAGALTKIGAGTARLEAANTYAGDTTINVGTLALGTNGTIGTGSAITMAAGATLDVISQGGFTVASGKTMTAAGTVNGALTVASGATLQVGSATNTGPLTVTNGNVVLHGTTLMKLDAATKANDLITTSNTITLGGTLTVSILTGTPAPGDTYKLFNAPVLNGSFATINLPPLASGQIWVNNLAANGTITVGQLVLSMNSIPGGFLQFTWPTVLNGLVKLQAQTNSLAVGISNNWADYPGGAFNGVVHIPSPTHPTVFFRLVTQ